MPTLSAVQTGTLIQNEFTTRPNRFEDLIKLSEAFPGVGEAVLAVAAQNTNSEIAELLDQYTNKASVVQGRSASTPDIPEEEPEPVVEFYLRPNGEKYYTRAWGDYIDVDVLRRARDHEHYILLQGEPGCGKTALADAAFPDLHVVLGTGDTEVADFIGGYVQTPSGDYLWVDGPLIKAMENGEPLLIDEIGLVDPKVMSIVYSAMDGRREVTVTANPERGTVKSKKGFYVVAATNPNAPGVRLSEALLSRFAIHAEVTTDWDLALKLGVPTTIVTVARNLAKRRNNNEVSWGPQFRELLAFRDLCKDFDQQFAIANLLASAPEADRSIVADVLSRTYGATSLPARI